MILDGPETVMLKVEIETEAVAYFLQVKNNNGLLMESFEVSFCCWAHLLTVSLYRKQMIDQIVWVSRVVAGLL